MKGESSWICSAYPEKWAKKGCNEPGVDRSADAVGSSAVAKKTGKWMTIPIDAKLVQRWIKDPKSNRGVLLVGSGKRGTFHSKTFEDAGMTPRLILGFTSGVADGPVCTPQSCPVPAR